MGQFGLPPDVVAWCAMAAALGMAAVALASEQRLRLARFAERHYRLTLCTLALAAAALSIGYVAYYLRGGPRIIDATAYYQQARTFAAGDLTLPLFEPTTATRGRFLYLEPNHNTLGVIFPPGYAACLSLGFLVRSPYAIGAAIAGLLVWASASLTLRLFQRKDAALLAGLFSVTTAALRYHTADTMSHGFAALLTTLAVLGSLSDGMAGGILAGLSLGWLLATRPVTFAVVVLACVGYRLLHARHANWFLPFAAALVPGCALWLLYQFATTGSFTHATQMAYYSVADGPAGCFRYGFGKGIGCVFEHGSYIEKRLPDGYGLGQAGFVTLLRLRWHSLDLHNLEPLALATLIALAKAVRQPNTRLLAVAILGVFLGYMPFYFDGNYPGGGARFFADVIVLEHVLVAGWLVNTRWSRWFLPLSLTGFAVHGSFEHLQLRNRDGGRPMFEPAVLSDAGVSRGLVFVGTDHGFLLGHDPSARDPHRELVVLRHHGDAHDRVLWESLGRPQAYRYEFDPTEREARAHVSRIESSELLGLVRYEAESQWPVLAIEQGWVRPVYPPNGCTSARRGLALEPALSGASAQLTLYSEQPGTAEIELGFVARKAGHQRIAVRIGQREVVVDRDAQAHECFEARLHDVTLGRGEQSFWVQTNDLGVVLDYWVIGGGSTASR